MTRIRVRPIGFESLGVRSMSTFIETPDINVLADAGVALGPRFSSIPHPLEYKARNEVRKALRSYADKAHVVTVSHYHNDHHTPNFKDTVWLGSSPDEAEAIYKDKLVLVKDIRSRINFSQRRRGWMFQRLLEKKAKKYEVADGKTFKFGKTILKFSAPVSHGEEGSFLGWVLLLLVTCGKERVLYAPDVQGPLSTKNLSLILKLKPDLLILGGPPTYLSDFKTSEELRLKALRSMVSLASNVPRIILDHHLLRDAEWRKYSGPVFSAANENGHVVLTAAEFLGVPDQSLESKRDQLYKEFPPSEAFLEWSKLPKKEQKTRNPPLEE